MSWPSDLKKSRWLSLYTVAAAILYVSVVSVRFRHELGTLGERRLIALLAANLLFVGFLLFAAYRRWPRAHR
jgi:hypothetical protein